MHLSPLLASQASFFFFYYFFFDDDDDEEEGIPIGDRINTIPLGANQSLVATVNNLVGFVAKE